MARAAFLPYAQKRAPVLLQDFDNLSELTLSVTTGASIALNTEAKNILIGDASTLLTVGTGTTSVTFDIDPVSPQDIQTLAFRFRQPPEISSAAGSHIVYLATNSGFGAGTWTSATLVVIEGVEAGNSPSGWNFLIGIRANFTGGTPAILDGSSPIVAVRFATLANKDPYYLDAAYLNVQSNPSYLFMVDDVDDSWFAPNGAVFGGTNSAVDYMASLNIPGTWYLLTGAIDGTGTVTTAQMQSLYDAGWDICNHLYSTGDTIVGMTQAELFAELDQADGVLAANGWERGRKHFAYPGGNMTWGTHDEWLKSYGFYTARTIQGTLRNRQGIDFGNLHYLYAKGAAPAVTAQNMIDHVDNGVSSGGTGTAQLEQGSMIATYVHVLDALEGGPNDWDPTKLKSLLDHIASLRDQGLLSVLTISGWFTRLSGGVRLSAGSRTAVSSRTTVASRSAA